MTTSWFSLKLDTNGDGTGTKNAIVDGSSTPQVFKLSGMASLDLYVARMIVHISDVNDSNKYGDIDGPLTNGVSVTFYDGAHSLEKDMLDGVNVKSNMDWAQNCHDVTAKTFTAGPDFVQVRWSFEKAGKPLLIAPDDELRVIVNDDLSTLVAHYFTVQGHCEGDYSAYPTRLMGV